jgi:hypothetical protein
LLLSLFDESFSNEYFTQRRMMGFSMMNWEECERQRSEPILGYNPSNCMTELRKTTKRLRPYYLWTPDLSNAKQECQRFHQLKHCTCTVHIRNASSYN